MVFVNETDIIKLRVTDGPSKMWPYIFPLEWLVYYRCQDIDVVSLLIWKTQAKLYHTAAFKIFIIISIIVNKT